MKTIEIKFFFSQLNQAKIAHVEKLSRKSITKGFFGKIFWDGIHTHKIHLLSVNNSQSPRIIEKPLSQKIPKSIGVTAMINYRSISVFTFIGGQNNGLNSQMVRQSLRTVVSGRQTGGNGNGASNSGIRRNMSSPMDLGPNGGSLDNGNPNSNNLMINPQQQQTQQQQMINADMDSSMRFNFDMPQGELHTYTDFIDTSLSCEKYDGSNDVPLNI